MRVRAWWRSPEDQPRWARPALLGLAVVAGFLDAWNATGNLEIYYAAAVRSMSIVAPQVVEGMASSAIVSGRLRSLIVAGILVGLAFQAKMIEAWRFCPRSHSRIPWPPAAHSVAA